MKISDCLSDTRVKAFIDNMAGIADAIWVVDIDTGVVHIVFDAIIPEREGTTTDLDYEFKMLATCNHPLDIETFREVYTTEYLSKLEKSFIHDARGYMFEGKNHALRRIFTPQINDEGKVECVIISFVNRFEMLGRHEIDSMIADVFSEEYENVLLVDIENAQVEMRKAEGYFFTDEIQRELGRVPYDYAWDFFSKSTIHPDDREYVKEAVELGLVLEKLENNKAYSVKYRTIVNGLHYRQAVFHKMRETHIIIGFRNIDDVVALEATQRTQIESALEAAKKANHAKTVFLNNMSHDIRTPMNAIMGFTNLALANVEKTDKVKDYLSKIQTASAHLLSLINDVLDMSRIESGRIVFNRVETNVPQIIDNLKNIINEDARSKHINLTFEQIDVTDDAVLCDVLRLDQMLLNCLSNAIKYTPSGGRVSFSIQQLPPKDEERNYYTIIIKDTGIGMDQEYVEHIFEPFSRERNSTVSGIQGTGLGMSIVKNLIDLNSDTIKVTSEKGKGTEIEIGLKLIKSECKYLKTSEKEIRVGRDSLDGLRILLVEDNAINREIATEILSAKGANVDTANDGAVAVRKLYAADVNRYDLILMDIQMPVMSGYEATRKIRDFEDKRKASIPIIAMTANAFDEDKRQAIEAGMDGHIAKPIEIDKMMDTILTVLENKKEEGNENN